MKIYNTQIKYHRKANCMSRNLEIITHRKYNTLVYIFFTALQICLDILKYKYRFLTKN